MAMGMDYIEDNAKKFESKSITVRDFSGQLYRYTYHAGSDLIELEEMKEIGFWNKKWEWSRIYLGFAGRLQNALDFYNEVKNKV